MQRRIAYNIHYLRHSILHCEINIIFELILILSPERKRLLGRPRRRWEDNIKMGV
jgi:hypothetical protein